MPFRFDTGGPGSCLKRYSDPSYFRRVSGNVTEPDAEKLPKDKRAKKSKVILFSITNSSHWEKCFFLLNRSDLMILLLNLFNEQIFSIITLMGKLFFPQIIVTCSSKLIFRGWQAFLLVILTSQVFTEILIYFIILA